MNKQLKSKISEAFSAVLPITIIVLLLSIFWVPMLIGTTVMFIVGAALLIVGMGIFTLGVDMSMLPMGESIGEQFTQTKRIGLVLVICFGMGVMITIAEPDLQVLAAQLSSIPSYIIIGAVAIGVGAFLVLAILRVKFRIPLSRMLIVTYIILFIISIFVPKEFLSVAFDSGGVTTGPITVPFILALGLGFSALNKDKDAKDDSFGLVALCSAGPILMTMLLGIVYNPEDIGYASVTLPEVVTTRDVVRQFTHEIPVYVEEVMLAVVPILFFLLVFQIVTKRFKKRQMLKMIIGFAYTYIGLVLFLTGVNVGFIPVGNLLGAEIASSPFKWLLIPLGMIIGYFIVMAEPAVHVLNHQVEEVSGGTITASAVQKSLSFGVAVSLGIAMLRVLTGISIYWFLIPGYALSLILSFFVPKIFTGIAFDSGGVASGPMTSTFLLPFAMGASEAAGGNVLTDAFGIVAMVAMTPLIALQVLGFVYSRNMKIAETDENQELIETGALNDDADEIIEYDVINL